MRIPSGRLGAAVLAACTATTVALMSPVAAQAAADPAISSATASPSALVVNGDAGCGDKVKLTVKIYDPSGELGTINVSAVVNDGAGEGVDFLFFHLDSRSGDYFTVSDSVFICAPAETPGVYQAHVTLDWYDADANYHEAVRDTSFTIRRPTSLTYNASPEPVKRGKSLTHTGQLKFDPYSWGDMYGAKGVTVKFYFRKYSWTNYVYKGSVVTGSGGKYSKKIAAWDSGWWKAVYVGSNVRQPQTKWDEVVVKR